MWPHLSLPPAVIVCVSKAWPQKQSVRGVARAQGTPLGCKPGELPSSRISHPPHIQTAVIQGFAALLRGGTGGSRTPEEGGSLRCAEPALAGRGLPAVGRLSWPRRQSFALAMAWNLRVASSASSPWFLSGWKMSASRLNARFTSSAVQSAARPRTKRAATSPDERGSTPISPPQQGDAAQGPPQPPKGGGGRAHSPRAALGGSPMGRHAS
mmetsp:Transcript_4340/g.9314  ORF Transcript_4340/g.9314 Transcript_4340/m.9314 type:complete len:211 (-) Transcript_4340:8-640(-)